MPGVKTVTWSDANKALAMDALIGYASIKVDNGIAEKIALHVGGTCTGKAVQSFFSCYKRKFQPRDGNPAPTASSSVRAAQVPTPRATPKKRAGTTRPADESDENRNDLNVIKKIKVKHEDTDHDDHKDGASLQITQQAPMTPVKVDAGKEELPSPESPCRSSSRPVRSVNYHQIAHPFGSMDGTEDYYQQLSDEESFPSDVEYKIAEEEVEGDDDGFFEV